MAGLAPQAQQAELQQLLAQEADLTARYTDDYPDVVTVRRKIAELRQKMAEAPPPTPASAATTPTPRLTEPLAFSSCALRFTRWTRQSRRRSATRQRSRRSCTVSGARHRPVRRWRKSTRAITRDNQTAQAFYDDLLNKMNQSKMATDLEKRQQGEQFRVMDEPNLPEAPSSPKRPVFVGGGLAAGLDSACSLLALLEYLDTAVRSERDIWAFTKLPTLGVSLASMASLSS